MTKQKKTEEGIVENFSLVMPAEGQKLTVYMEFIQDIQEKTGHFDRSLGYLSWATGKVLSLARPACKAKGSWSQFLNTIDVGDGKKMKVGSAALMMKIATMVDEQEAKKWSYTQMLALVYPNTYGKDIKSNEETEETGNGGKGKRKTNPVKPQPLTSTAYESAATSILKQSQKLTVGFLDGGKSLNDEIETLKNAQRAIQSSSNDLSQAIQLVKDRIASLSLAEKTVKTVKKNKKAA